MKKEIHTNMKPGTNDKSEWYCTDKEQYCKDIKVCEIFEAEKYQIMNFDLRCENCFFLVEKDEDTV